MIIGFLDDTLAAVKREHLKLVHDALNSFEKNLNFTFDTFDNVVSHFLDTEIHRDGLSICCRDTTQDNTLIITVIPHGATKHLAFLPLYAELSIFVIKRNYKQNSQE